MWVLSIPIEGLQWGGLQSVNEQMLINPLPLKGTPPLITLIIAKGGTPTPAYAGVMGSLIH